MERDLKVKVDSDLVVHMTKRFEVLKRDGLLNEKRVERLENRLKSIKGDVEGALYLLNNVDMYGGAEIDTCFIDPGDYTTVVKLLKGVLTEIAEEHDAL